MQVLRQLPHTQHPNLLVGATIADDAGVYRIDHDRALVQTVDFFTPIVDDPFAYGAIAAANALSDVYAMGGRPLTAMNIMGIPEDIVPPQIVNAIFKGGLFKIREAGCVLVGGHTIRNPEPVYGLSVTGMVSPRAMLTNAAARAGDLLVLTKPLGTGIITTGIKRGLTPRSLARRAVQVMCSLNRVGAEIAEKGLVRACTDITGFGLLGHLGSMCRASGVGMEIFRDDVPVIAPEVYDLIAKGSIPGGTRDNLKQANEFVNWGKTREAQRILLSDAQTSGGLILCVSERNLNLVLKIMKCHHTHCAVIIGHVVKSSRSRITVR